MPVLEDKLLLYSSDCGWLPGDHRATERGLVTDLDGLNQGWVGEVVTTVTRRVGSRIMQQGHVQKLAEQHTKFLKQCINPLYHLFVGCSCNGKS